MLYVGGSVYGVSKVIFLVMHLENDNVMKQEERQA